MASSNYNHPNTKESNDLSVTKNLQWAKKTTTTTLCQNFAARCRCCWFLIRLLLLLTRNFCCSEFWPEKNEPPRRWRRTPGCVPAVPTQRRWPDLPVEAPASTRPAYQSATWKQPAEQCGKDPKETIGLYYTRRKRCLGWQITMHTLLESTHTTTKDPQSR